MEKNTVCLDLVQYNNLLRRSERCTETDLRLKEVESALGYAQDIIAKQRDFLHIAEIVNQEWCNRAIAAERREAELAQLIRGIWDDAVLGQRIREMVQSAPLLH